MTLGPINSAGLLSRYSYAQKFGSAAVGAPNADDAQKNDEAQKAQQAEFEKKRDEINNHVIAHEQKHLDAAGKYAEGGIHIDYDENGVAKGGHVNVKMPALNKDNPEETIEHAKTIQKSATAPDDPSDQDLKVYAEASKVLFQAQQLLNKNKSEKAQQ